MKKKKPWRLVIATTTLALLSSILISPSAQATTYVFGDTGPAGGKIFLTPSSAGNTTGLYFEAAPLDVSASRFLWCNSSNQSIPGANGTVIGTGKTNTQAMLNHGCTAGAGYQASQYSGGGFTDWFLPSADEVVEAQKLYGNGLFTGTGLDNLDIHWSSTWVDASTSYIWYPYLTGASLTTSYSLAGGGFFVRAVRSFATTTTQNNDSAENQRKRQVAIDNARAVILKKVNAKESLNVTELQAAEEPALSAGLLAELNRNLLALDRTSEIKYSLVAFQIAKYKAYDQIAGNLAGKTYPRNLITYGIIDASYPMKSLAFSRLMNLPVDDRDSITEIDTFLTKEAASNAALKAKVQVRATAKR
jgi:hypothetical protein